jgi:hypothetical protein
LKDTTRRVRFTDTKSHWTHGPELAQVLYDLLAWEKAQARNELVRICYLERIVGLLRNKKISASVHRRAGSQAAQDFARLLDAEGKIGYATMSMAVAEFGPVPIKSGANLRGCKQVRTLSYLHVCSGRWQSVVRILSL